MGKGVYFAELDGLRTLACLLVVVGHSFREAFSNLAKHSFFDNGVYTHFISTIGAGKEGVSIFFVLSGFLITYLLLKEIEDKGKIHVGKFYLRRALRIWPLYYAVMFFGLFLYPNIVNLAGQEYNEELNYILNLTFLNNFVMLNTIGQNVETYLPHVQIAWSVAIEEQFYLFWPLLFLFKPTKKSLPILFGMLIIISIGFYMLNRNNPGVLYFHILGQIHNLVWGGVGALFIFYNKQIKELFNNLKNRHRCLIYLIGTIMFVFRNDLLQYLDYYFLRTMLSFFYTFVILDQSLNISEKFKFNKTGFFVAWGKYSYGMYLLHFIGLLLIKNVFDFINVRLVQNEFFSYKESVLGGFMVGIIGVILGFILAYFSYHFYEKPFLNFKNRFKA